MSTWQSQTVVSLLEHDAAVRVFNIWTMIDNSVKLPEEVTTWHVPSFAALHGTTLGATDFDAYSGGFGFGTRFSVRSGKLVPLERHEWQTMPMEDQFDAILYLGPPSSMTNATIPAALCQDSSFVAERLQRLMRFGPPVEVENLKKACGLPPGREP